MRLLLVVLIFGLFLMACKKEAEKPLNILMIAVDDLRPELGCYGNDLIKSPNIDQLANDGVVFENSYCNIPVCGASRASLMVGARPTRNRFLHYYTESDVEMPEAVCLSQHFKNNGYYTISNGKVFHTFSDRAESWDENWRPDTGPTWRDYHINENITLQNNGSGPPYECMVTNDTIYHDGKVAEKTIADLKHMKETGKPFFIASGFVKPHLPFNAPKRYWDLYSKEDFTTKPQEFSPTNAPREAFHSFGELRDYHNIPKKGYVPDSMSINMQHGYYACVSYIDAQIGKVLKALDELGLAENTVVILWGDHGYNLGDHGLWCKHCNFNTALQTPLIVKAPGKSNGIPSKAMVEFVDIYPTLCELAGLNIPETVEGESLLPLLNDPLAQWKDYVICKWFDGLTIKTKDYAYTEWRNDQDSLVSEMLYDHKADKEEMNNLVGDAKYTDVIKELKATMNANKGKDYFAPCNTTQQHVDH